MTDIYLQSKFVGTTENGPEFAEKIREKRRKGEITSNLNVYFNKETDEVWLENGRGRVRRPLLVIKDGRPLLTEKHVEQLQKKEIQFGDLVKEGVIEYLDAAEEENALVAFFSHELTPEHTHLQISPLDMLGYCNSLVP